MKNTNGKPPESAVEHAIANKTRLIKKLRKEIEAVRADAEAEVKQIEGRIFMAQTLLTALQKGK